MTINPLVPLKAATPEQIHTTTNVAISFGVVATLGLHLVNPLAEAVSFAVTGLMATWANDIEKRLVHFAVAARLDADKLEALAKDEEEAA